MLGVFSVRVVLMLLRVSCATDQASLERYQAQYQAATNTVAVIHTAVQPYIPAPMNTATEGVFAVVTGLLAALNTWQHRQIAKLKEAQNGTGRTASPAAASAQTP